MQAKDWHFPMPCPVCGVVTRAPYRAWTGDAVLWVELRCDTCRHEWTLTAPAPTVILMPQSDRRFDASWLMMR